MPKKGKKKAHAIGGYPDVEIFPKMEIIYEDTKSIIGLELEFKWGRIYQMIKDQTVADAGLKDMPLYVNIRRSAITKVATCPEIFPCAEVIGWILSQADATTMIMLNTEKQHFASFSPSYIAEACKLPAPHIFMTDKWVGDLDLDVLDCAKKMMIFGKQFLHKALGEYENSNLSTLYSLIALMLNQIFG